MTAPENQTILRKNSYEGENFSFSICHIDSTKGHNRYDSRPKTKQFSEKFLIREKFFVFQSVILIVPKVPTDMTARRKSNNSPKKFL